MLRTSSPLAREPYNAPSLAAQNTGVPNDWAVPAQEKAQYDAQFSRLDSNKQGFVGGEQAVAFFSNSKLSENDLAQIWDLADITQTGQLNQEEFAVAMHLIRQQVSSRGPLPATLPQNLVPPSMRQQVPMPAAPDSQASPAVPPPPKPKSAADDLFGLDALTAPTQIPQSTGGSSSVAAPSVSHSTSSPSPQQQSTHFRPFVPSSTFGQSLATPQATGAAGGASSPQQLRALPDDDLLGDTDPEVSKKFTNETTELANLSNQVNNLTNQMKDVQSKQVTNKQELSQVANQKRDFETRLSQLRSAYEQEARDLKSLQDRLATAKSETKKLHQDLAMTQHSYENLQEQRQQVIAGLEADQRENTNLKDRIAQVFKETNQIKPQIEKLRSDARQQKGLVAINKKQLSTAEAEREKAKVDLGSATSEYDEATKELEDSNRGLEASRTATPSAVASPAPSTSSMNPFFRRTASTTSARATTQSPFAAQPVNSPNHSAFDSFFGSALEDSRPFTSSSDGLVNEGNRTPQQAFERPPSGGELSQVPKKEESPCLPATSQPPPPPPHSGQMTPSSLPLRENVQRAPSSTSSVGVMPPTSQFDELSEAATPTKDKEPLGSASVSHNGISPPHTQAGLEQTNTTETHSPQATTPHEPLSAPPNIPGAFPSDITPAETPITSTQREAMDTSPFHTDTNEPPKESDGEAKSAFDAALGSYEAKGKAPISSSAFGGSMPTSNTEFPPIQELGGDDDDSESDEENGSGFDDHFAPTAASKGKGQEAPSLSILDPPRPPLSRGVSGTSELPTPNAQKSPPTYEETVSPTIDGGPRDANRFAAEYSGLLPSREDPTSSPHLHSVDYHAGASGSSNDIPATSVTAIENPPRVSPQQQYQAPSVPSKTAFDDFDSAFGDLSEAQAVDDKGDEDFGISGAREGFDEFNPTFDSPAPSQAHSKAPTLDQSGFQDFESSFSAPAQSISASAPGAPTRPGPTKDEWDAMFAGFGGGNSDAGAPAEQTNGESAAQRSDGFLNVFSVPDSSAGGNTAAQQHQQSQGQMLQPKPPLSRGVSTATEHDDPIVKRLTGMGYSRDASVEALERFDYNLDKVR